jgi:hypothetical protein
MYTSIPLHNRLLYNRANNLPARTALVRPHHLSRRQLIRTVPWLEINSLVIILERLLDRLEQRVRLVLINTHVITNRQDDLTDLLLFAVFVVFLVLVEGDGNVDACFGGPGSVDGEPV